jgi:GT2 family glycosyltransferase
MEAVYAYLRLPVQQRPQISVYFDREFYLSANKDVARSGIDPLLHFVAFGCAEGRSPHPLVSMIFITSDGSHLVGDPPSPDLLGDMLENDLGCPSPYFDPHYYRQQLDPSVNCNGLLRHFLSEGLGRGLKPNAWLDPAWYSAQYDDLPKDPYRALVHFILAGDAERRSAGPEFSGIAYCARYSDVANATLPPLHHFLVNGRFEGREPAVERESMAPLAVLPSTPATGPFVVDAEAVWAADLALRTRLNREMQARKDAVDATPPELIRSVDPVGDIARMAFDKCAFPRLSILIPAFNALDYTVECLLSIINSAPRTPYEIIVADDCSTDPNVAQLGKVANLVYVRQRENVGFLRNCNGAFGHCRGEYVFLLNNDAQVCPGTIDELVGCLDADESVAAVGPKVIFPDGRLQEAGCFLRPNGESGMVGLFRNPRDGVFCYDRDVHYCSGAALMVRRLSVGGTLFDETYAPAYCEDADLCLRLQEGGHRVRYSHRATVIHHLSVSTDRLPNSRKRLMVSRNQQLLVEKWGGRLAQLDRVRVIAFYLPQFHRTEENDLWWGKGFSDWTNVVKAQPVYPGHYQPHLPTDLGFYDLRVPDTLRSQAELAARYGIEGFCVYQYNFGGRRLLWQPIDAILANRDIPFRWCTCWANENWTRRWDGGDGEILIKQNYDSATIDSVLDDALDQATDPRYLRVSGKPIFLVYRPLFLPNPPTFAHQCRARFEAAGFPGVHLVLVESMEAVGRKVDPASLGFDACVEFPPHGQAARKAMTNEPVSEGWTGDFFDYPETVVNCVIEGEVPYRRYPSVFPAWDNTARQPRQGNVFRDFSPEAFRIFVEEKLEILRQFLVGEERLLFVNAWNEWAEGSHLEPDIGYGHRWLEALRDALATRRTN